MRGMKIPIFFRKALARQSDGCRRLSHHSLVEQGTLHLLLYSTRNNEAVLQSLVCVQAGRGGGAALRRVEFFFCFFCVRIAVRMMSKSEARSPVQSPLSSPALDANPTISLRLCFASLRPHPARRASWAR